MLSLKGFYGKVVKCRFLIILTGDSACGPGWGGGGAGGKTVWL